MTSHLFAVLGPVEVHVSHARVALGGQRNTAILATLLLDAGRVVSIRRLVDAAWGDNPPASARAQIQNSVSALRRRIAGGRPELDVIATRQPGYLLDLSDADLDLHRFERERSRAEEFVSRGSLTEASATLGAALDLWRGPALHGLTTPVLQAAAVRLDELHLDAVQRRIQIDLDLGRHREIIAELISLTQTHPYQEGLYALLMQALHRSGRQTEALQTYQRLRWLLSTEVGIEPGDRVRLLHEAMLQGDEVVPTTPEDTTPAPVIEVAPIPRELPADAVGFTGRSRELADLDALLPEPAGDAPSATIAVIAGTAGVGKTALAVYWGHRCADHFPDGQLYINLRGYATAAPMQPAEALGSLLRSMGIRPERVPTEVAEASAMYRSVLAGKRVLIVIDNARSAEAVRPLLPGAPGCRVLITSRDRLAGLVARDGARRTTLGVLPADEAESLLTWLLGADRSRAEPAALTELAALCSYLPLALRVAVANLAHRPHHRVADLVAALRSANRITVLAADDDRESTVQVAFDLSYEALPADTQRLFCLLGLIPGDDCTVAAAAALSGTHPAQVGALLDQLAGAHLIEEHASDRYRLQDLLRRYAHDRAVEHMSAAEIAAAVQRLYAWYLSMVDAAAHELYPRILRLPHPAADEFGAQAPERAEDTDLMRWFDAERHNLAAVVRHAASRLDPTAWLLTDWLRGCLWRRGYLNDWFAPDGAGAAALTAAQAAGSAIGEAALRNAQALVHAHRADLDAAATQLSAAVDRSAAAGWTAGHAATLGNLGNIHLSMGHTERALDLHQQALRHLPHGATEPHLLRASYLNNVGEDYCFMGRLRPSLHHLHQALRLFRQVGDDPAGEANTLDSLAKVYHELGRLGPAVAAGTRSLTLIRQLGHVHREVEVTPNLAAIYADLGRYDEALRLAEGALRLARELGARQPEAHALSTIAAVDEACGRTRKATNSYERVLRLTSGTRFPYRRVVAMMGLARCTSRLRRHDDALATAESARQVANGCGFAVMENLALAVIAEVLANSGRPEEAATHALRALDRLRHLGHRMGEVHTLVLLGRIPGVTDGAGYRRQARELCVATGIPCPAEAGESGPQLFF